MYTMLFPIAFRPSPVACIPNVRSFSGGDGGGGMTAARRRAFKVLLHGCQLLRRRFSSADDWMEESL